MTKPKPKTARGQDINYGKNCNAVAIAQALKVDTSDQPKLEDMPRLDLKKHPHLVSAKWRRDGRTLVHVVSNTPGDNLETRHLRKLEPMK